ncbi:MAG: DUF1850 domain-containing protein [Oscillospiraceae bacterium]|nr:DUF1850 domain-containing protein [Oscillospiraceae bacterium]
MKRNKRGLIAASVALIILAASLCFMEYKKYQHVQLLVLTNVSKSMFLIQARAPDGTDFSISYIHSVNKSPITEYYEIIEGEIYLKAIRFESFGAGVETELSDGQNLIVHDEYMMITGIDRHIPVLFIYIGRSEGQIFEIYGIESILNNFGNPGELLSFQIKN